MAGLLPRNQGSNNAMFRNKSLKSVAATLFITVLLVGNASFNVVQAQVPSRIDLTFDDCVATTSFGREVDLATSARFEWICSFLLFSADTGTLSIAMSHDECVVSLLSNLWRLEILAKIGRDICDSLAHVSENPSILTPEPTRTPWPTPTRVPSYIEIICESEDHSRALRGALVENDIYAYLSRQSYEGRMWARVLARYSPNSDLLTIIRGNTLACSIPE